AAAGIAKIRISQPSNVFATTQDGLAIDDLAFGELMPATVTSPTSPVANQTSGQAGQSTTAPAPKNDQGDSSPTKSPTENPGVQPPNVAVTPVPKSTPWFQQPIRVIIQLPKTIFQGISRIIGRWF